MAEQKSNIGYTPRPTQLDVYEVQNGQWIDTRELTVQKDEARLNIDQYAETVRELYITSSPGQVATYNEKYLDAKAYADAGYPVIGSPVQYLFVQAEVVATGLTSQQAADLIISTRNLWIILAAKIEEERRKGKINVDAATTSNEIETAKQAALAALSLI